MVRQGISCAIMGVREARDLRYAPYIRRNSRLLFQIVQQRIGKLVPFCSVPGPGREPVSFNGETSEVSWDWLGGIRPFQGKIKRSGGHGSARKSEQRYQR